MGLSVRTPICGPSSIVVIGYLDFLSKGFRRKSQGMIESQNVTSSIFYWSKMPLWPGQTQREKSLTSHFNGRDDKESVAFYNLPFYITKG